MEVERVEGDRKKILILLFIAIVIIVGLLVAIVVIVGTRGNKNSSSVTIEPQVETEVEEMSIEEATEVYEKIATDVARQMAEDPDITLEEAAELYQARIDEESDPKVKAMIELDLLLVKMAQNPSEKEKGEIIDAAIRADDILHTFKSAITTMNIAYYYQDEEVSKKYNALAMERMPKATDAVNSEEEETAP